MISETNFLNVTSVSKELSYNALRNIKKNMKNH